MTLEQGESPVEERAAAAATVADEDAPDEPAAAQVLPSAPARPARPRRRYPWAAISALATLLAALAATSGEIRELFDGDNPPAAVGPSIAELARATVSIEAIKDNGTPEGEFVIGGSGSVVAPEGYILTAAHIVDNRLDAYDRIVVGVTDRLEAKPDRRYLAEVKAIDYGLDLAVLRIVSDRQGNPLLNEKFQFVNVGDSEEVTALSHVRILGYPSMGGDTVTATSGEISGFFPQEGLPSEKGWIKTTAIIGAGSSGGMAVNDAGELIGVPLTLGSGECRVLADTNGDGKVDDKDFCQTVGGILNGVRPINYAKAMIAAAEAGKEYVTSIPTPPPAATAAPPPEFASFTSLVFSDGVDANGNLTRVLKALPAGASLACGSWDFAGMTNGAGWQAEWYVNGTLRQDYSLLDGTWTDGKGGSFYFCARNLLGLETGLFELALYVGEDLMLNDSVYVGGSHPVVNLTLTNNLLDVLCLVFISPHEARHWGQDELGMAETLSPGQSSTFAVPAAIYDLRGVDCQGEEVYSSLTSYPAGVNVSQALTFALRN
jgi:S1-C subfamily serine protease